MPAYTYTKFHECPCYQRQTHTAHCTMSIKLYMKVDTHCYKLVMVVCQTKFTTFTMVSIMWQIWGMEKFQRETPLFLEIIKFPGASDSGWQWHQLDHMQICTLTHTHNHTSIAPLSFYVRQHICYSAYMPWNSVCLSVCLSFTRVDQSKTVEARITQFSPYSSPIPLV